MNIKVKIFFYLVIFILFQNNLIKSQSLWQPWYISPRSGVHHNKLSGNWQLSYMDSALSDLKKLAQSNMSFQITIPNSVHWLLYKAGKLPHPYYNKNSDGYKWTDEKYGTTVKNLQFRQMQKNLLE